MSKPNQTPPAGAPVQNKTEHKTENKKGPPKGPTGEHKGNVLALPGSCMAEECKKRAEKANFCMEHFDWFKEGLITKEGRRPSDFEKKLSDYNRRHKKSA